MATAITDSTFKEGYGCSICLDDFTSPRHLPCLHSFCEHCLQDYITKKAGSTDKTFEEFMCPVCRAVTRPANKEKPVREWASLFPKSSFALVGKSKVDWFCEVCLNSSDNSRNIARKFCIVCEESMCDVCSVCHQNMRMTKSHQIITMEEFENNPEHCIKFAEGFGCPEHDNDEMKFYCRSHDTACCATCSFLHHRACLDVLELKQYLPHLLKELKPRKIMEQMRKLEGHLSQFMEVNEEDIGILESHVNNIYAEIGDIRKKLNTVLDDIEKMVKLEGNRIYKEWLIRKQEQNHQCQSLVNAIRTSQTLLETVDKHGSDTQKFQVNSKTMKQLHYYGDQIREHFERVDTIRIRLELDSNMKAVLSKDAVGLVKIVCQEETRDLQFTGLRKSFEKRTVELSRIIDVHCPIYKNPVYRGIVQLPDENIVLIDCDNNACCLYDSSCNFITSHILPEKPEGLCLIGDNEVAIAIAAMKTVQFMSIINHSIVVTGTVRTNYKCFGVDAVSREEIVVSGQCGDIYSNKCYWSRITRNGDVKLHHEFDCQSKTYYVYAAVDMSKSRVYISVSGNNAVHCFSMTDGKQYFVYLSSNLKFPMGLAVDRENNVYVLGHDSNNIHKLSPDGVKLQIITSGVPTNPIGISFNYSRDHVIITIGSRTRKLHYLLHK